MSRYIVARVMGQVNKRILDHYKKTGKGLNIAPLIKEALQEHATDRRYKIHILACSTNGAFEIDTAKLQYMGATYHMYHEYETGKKLTIENW